VLDLPYEYSLNHEFIPGCLLLAENLDLFSRSLRQYSLSLAKLVLKANQLSAELFWPADESITDPYWPNLHTLAIRTSTETAEGRWVLHPQDPRFAFFEYAEDMDWDFEDLEELIANSEQLTVEFESGTYPQHTFRARPEHTFFNTLAMSIARAASNMPKLKELLYDMESSARDPSGDRIHGYAFSFHGGDDKQPPRTDWVFPCYHGQLIGWSQPAEASRVWKEKCGGGLIENVLALDDESHGGETSWKVWQNGLDIGIGSDLAEHFQGYEFECHDLLNQ
jgi:hypothetical protein